MNLFNFIILGIIQGLTEFLPVSSSGHLVIFQKLLNFNEPGIVFEITVHIATLLAVIFYFRKDVVKLIIALFNWKKNRSKEIRFYQQLLLFLIIASLVTAVIGFTFKDILESFFDNLFLVGVMLLVTGLILFISDKIKNDNRDKLNVPASLFIGFAQSIAIIPGISRSGSTITAGIFSGLRRELATKFSFLLSIPAILGTGLLKFKEFNQVALSDGLWFYYLIAGITATIVGYFAIAILIKLIQKARLFYFSIYCWIVGLVTIFVML